MIEYLTFDANLTIEDVQNQCDAYVKEKTAGEYEGLQTPIRIVSTGTARTKEAAIALFEQADYGYYDSMAMKTIITENKVSATYAAVQAEVAKLQKKYNELREPHFEEFKSKLISCKGCGSKLSTKHLHDIYCPLCRGDLRPNGTIEREKKIFERFEKKQQALDVLVSKGKDEPISCKTVKWFVKIEY